MHNGKRAFGWKPWAGVTFWRAGGGSVCILALVLLGVSSEMRCGQGWRERRAQRRHLTELFGAGEAAAIAPPADSDRLPPPKYAVAYTVLEMRVPDYKGDPRTVGVAVWYPTASEVRPHHYVLGRNWLATNVAVDGKPASGPFPFVLFSHGGTGTGLNATFLTERLAGEGFVVAAPDYPDKYYEARIHGPQPRLRPRDIAAITQWLKDIRRNQLNRGGKAYRHAKLAYRPTQAKATIDRILAENKTPGSRFYGLIDEERIGAIGHSFGAWTSILIGGADPRFADPRVKAIVALSGPCNDSVYEPDELGNIKVPIMFMLGGEEVKAGRGDDRKYLYGRANPPKFLLEVACADHFSFSGGI